MVEAVSVDYVLIGLLLVRFDLFLQAPRTAFVLKSARINQVAWELKPL